MHFKDIVNLTVCLSGSLLVITRLFISIIIGGRFQVATRPHVRKTQTRDNSLIIRLLGCFPFAHNSIAHVLRRFYMPQNMTQFTHHRHFTTFAERSAIAFDYAVFELRLEQPMWFETIFYIAIGLVGRMRFAIKVGTTTVQIVKHLVPSPVAVLVHMEYSSGQRYATEATIWQTISLQHP